MNRKQFTLIAVLTLMLIGIVTVFVVQPLLTAPAEAAGPCKPCDTWGSVKACYRDTTPPACCDCTKGGYEFEQTN